MASNYDATVADEMVFDRVMSGLSQLDREAVERVLAERGFRAADESDDDDDLDSDDIADEVCDRLRHEVRDAVESTVRRMKRERNDKKSA